MNRNEMSRFLQRVLDAVAQRSTGVSADADGIPDAAVVREIAQVLGAGEDEVHWALIGLRSSECLTEHSVEFEGIETSNWWTVHPQCQV